MLGLKLTSRHVIDVKPAIVHTASVIRYSIIYLQ